MAIACDYRAAVARLSVRLAQEQPKYYDDLQKAAKPRQIGQYLTEVKKRLEHGQCQFLEWIEKEFSWKRTSAERFMSVYENVQLPNLGESSMYRRSTSSLLQRRRSQLPSWFRRGLIATPVHTSGTATDGN